MRHQDLTINHRLESWVYANAAARLTATGMLPADVGRVAYQVDTGQYWRLTDDSPLAWQSTGAPYASLVTAQLSPTGTSSSTVVMMGMGSSTSFTPLSTGKVIISFSGNIANSSTGGAQAQIRFAQTSVTAVPSNGATGVGTAAGGLAKMLNLSSGAIVPISLSAIASGLAIGSPYWFDLGLLAITTGTATVASVVVTLVETA